MGVVGYLESQVERTEGAFVGFPAMEPLVQHPVRKEPSRKLSGSEVSPRPCTRIASWELSMTAQRGALNSLRKDDKQSGTHEERGPDVKI